MAKVQVPNGVEIWRGPSQIDGQPIVVIATGLADKSRNGKTGALIQCWILCADVSPRVAVNTGQDAAICGECKHRGIVVTVNGELRNKKRRCYVRVSNAPRSVWSSWKRGIYPTAWDESTFAGRAVRLGAYGDPAAVPYHVWARVLSLAAFHTGYTHQWSRFPEFAAWCMASVDTAAERLQAKFLGYRTFRVRGQGESRDRREAVCGASKEAGHKTNCFDCHACDGTEGNGKALCDIVIIDHGPMRASVNRATRALAA